MNDNPLERLGHLHRDIAALAASGIPIDLGQSDSSESIAQTLSRWESQIRSGIEQGRTALQVLQESHDLPLRYRLAAHGWLTGIDPRVALEQVTGVAVSDVRARRSLVQTLFYPALIGCTTIVGFVVLCQYAAPTMLAVYEQLSRTPSAPVSWLVAGQQWMPVIVPLIAIAGIGLWWIVQRQAPGHRWLPGGRRMIHATECADVAEQIATFLNLGMSVEQAIAMSGLDNDPTSPLVTSRLLDWAVRGPITAGSRENVLRLVANVYRQQARHYERVMRSVGPAVIGVAIGGMFVLTYGLSLFVPLVELLKDLALPGGI